MEKKDTRRGNARPPRPPAGRWNEGVDFSRPVDRPPPATQDPRWRPRLAAMNITVVGDEEILPLLPPMPPHGAPPHAPAQPLHALLEDNNSMHKLLFPLVSLPTMLSMKVPLLQHVWLIQSRNNALHSEAIAWDEETQARKVSLAAEDAYRDAVKAKRPQTELDVLKAEMHLRAVQLDAVVIRRADARKHITIEQERVEEGQRRIVRMLKNEIPHGDLGVGLVLTPTMLDVVENYMELAGASIADVLREVPVRLSGLALLMGLLAWRTAMDPELQQEAAADAGVNPAFVAVMTGYFLFFLLALMIDYKLYQQNQPHH